MLKVNLYSAKGSKLRDFALPKDFYAPVNLALLAQALRVYEARGHAGTAKVKTRATIARTKKKWYRQKGTGGARHGARSAPIFVGGGVAHGPVGVKRELTLSQKMKKKALLASISAKGENKEMVILDGISKIGKTAEASQILKKLSSQAPVVKRFTLVLAPENRASARLFRNIKNIKIVKFSDLNAYSVFYGGLIIFDRQIFEKKLTTKLVTLTQNSKVKTIRKASKR